MFPREVVLVDTCVWLSRTLQDWVCLLHLRSQKQAFALRWTEDILGEFAYHLQRDRGLHGSALARRKDSLIEAIGTDNRVSVFSVGDVDCHDPNDAHLHAAAVAGNCTIVLTKDVDGLVPKGQSVDDLPYEIWTPDDFLIYITEQWPAVFDAVIKEQALYWWRRTDEGCDLSQALRNANCPQFAKAVAARWQGMDTSFLVERERRER